MPTYEYVCTECGERLEAVQKFSDAPLTTCPRCQGQLRKLFSSVGVVFKGSGFYKTDSRSTGKTDASPAKESAPKEAAAAGGSPAKDSGTSASSNGSGSSGTSTTASTSSSPSSDGSKVA
jgi:putative FmdB family regulatory protein